MKDLLLYIARSLVEHPDDVTVTEKQGADELTLELRVAPDDMGKGPRRSPQGERGLKFVQRDAGGYQAVSLPARGARVEISARTSSRASTRVAPRKGERGLKFDAAVDVGNHRGVAPRMGSAD